MRRFGGQRVQHLLEMFKSPPEIPIESKAVSRSIRSAQTQVEQLNFEMRKELLKYDDVMNRQRKVIYAERHRVLAHEDLSEQVRRMLDEVTADYVAEATKDGFAAEDWDMDRLWGSFQRLYPVGISAQKLIDEVNSEGLHMNAELLTERMQADAQAAYDRREAELGEEVMREFERRVVLAVLDAKWREHLYEMDYLQSGIHMRGHAQRDPLVEYQREGFELYSAMMDAIKEESVHSLFHFVPVVPDSPVVGEMGPDGEWVAAPSLAGPGPGPAEPAADQVPAAFGRGGSGRGGRGPGALAEPRRAQRLDYSAPSEDATGTATTRVGAAVGTDFSKVGRNQPCPCGSGKKFKL
jgi:preprotein translocase subunit SecA